MPLKPLVNPSKFSQRFAGKVRGAPIAVFLFVSLLGLNLIQTASVLLLPISRPRFRAVNRWAANLFWLWCVELSERVQGIAVQQSGDEIPVKEDAILTCNHQQMPDIVFLLFLARDAERLGDNKWVLKDIIKYVPGVGWGMLFLDSVFVKRNWSTDEVSIRKIFGNLVDNRVPMWLLSFPEGTRLTPAKLERSQAYARKQGLTVTEHVMLPRTKGFVASVRALRSHVKAVYDVTIGYEKGVPNLWQYVCGFAPKAHIHVRRYPIDTLPKGEQELSDWLVARYHEKDQLLADYYREGTFPNERRTT